MSKIPSKPPLPTEQPSPKKAPAASAAPPFTPSQMKRRAPAPPPANTAPQRLAPPRSMRQLCAAPQTAPRERQGEASSVDPGAERNAHTRFDNGIGQLPGQAFSEFSEYAAAPDTWGQRGAGASLQEAMQAAALEQGLDCAALARLLPAGGNDGIFDVVLPGGERLGVVVSGQNASLSYLLSPSPEKFGSRLRRQRMELEERMERLTHRNVNITVL